MIRRTEVEPFGSRATQPLPVVAPAGVDEFSVMEVSLLVYFARFIFADEKISVSSLMSRLALDPSGAPKRAL